MKFIIFVFLLIFGFTPIAMSADLPSWVSKLPLWQWYEIPNTALASVEPKPLPCGIEGGQAKINDWTGATLKRSGSIYMLGAAGGHGGYCGNEVDAIQLNSENPHWVELKAPSPPEAILDVSEFYLDLTRAATHTYYNTQFIESRNKMLIVTGGGDMNLPGIGTAPADWPYSHKNSLSNHLASFDLTKNQWDDPNYLAKFPVNPGCYGGIVSKDPKTEDIYFVCGYGAGWWKWVNATNTWMQLTSIYDGELPFVASAIDPIRNHMLILGSYGGGTPPRVRDLTNMNVLSVNFSGPGINLANFGPYAGLVYDEANDSFLAFYDGDPISTYRINPSTWFVDQPPITGKKPGYRPNGINNAIQYVPELGGVVIANSYYGNMFFMRTSSAGTMPPVPIPTPTPDPIPDSTPIPVPIPVPTPTPTPTPVPSVGKQLPVPSLEDEKATYTKWGWTWNPEQESSKTSEPWTVPFYVVDPSIHDGTEGDDLRTYLMMYRRTGNEMYMTRAKAWVGYFEDHYTQDCQGGNAGAYCYDKGAFGLDHAYGVGLIDWYLYTCTTSTCDIAALDTAKRVAADIETLWKTDDFGCYKRDGCTGYNLRAAGRQILLINRLAETTDEQRWKDLRDKMVPLVLNSSWYNSTYGSYFLSDYQTNQTFGPLAYSTWGIRENSPFYLGILVEAFYDVWRTTKRTDVKDRIVSIARYVDKYGLDPKVKYTGSHFGFAADVPWHNYSSGKFWDSNYTTSLVNVLVYGYKLTGDVALLDKAKIHFNRGTKGVYGSAIERQSADNVVSHFVDTEFDSSSGNFYLSHNKGELQYTYRIFENGGNPTLETAIPLPIPDPVPTPNLPPIVTLTADHLTGTAPLDVLFTAVANDPDGTISSYLFDAGDGNTATVPVVGHTYPNIGIYTAKVKVTDNLGATAISTVNVIVTAPVPIPEPIPTPTPIPTPALDPIQTRIDGLEDRTKILEEIFKSISKLINGNK